jgi:hypothetical protein
VAIGLSPYKYLVYLLQKSPAVAFRQQPELIDAFMESGSSTTVYITQSLWIFMNHGLFFFNNQAEMKKSFLQ